MISFVLDVEDLADTRFAISPLQELMGSLWALRDPGRYPLHARWHDTTRAGLRALDTRLLLALVGPTLALPDFLTPRPTTYAPTLDEQLETVGRTPPDVVRRDLLATYAPAPLPEVLGRAAAPGSGPVAALLADIRTLLRCYWEVALAPVWPRLRAALEADITYRARQLATGGARGLFSGLHPNLRWRDGVLTIDRMLGQYDVAPAGRGLPLVPSLFAYKPVPPMSPREPPMLAYPSRGTAVLGATPASPALIALLGASRARLLRLLAEPLTTADAARHLGVTPSAVSQQLQVLHAAGLVARARDGRRVLYRRTELGEGLAG